MASDKIIKQKSEAVDVISKKIEESTSVIIVNYKGLGVSDMTELRKELRNEGVEFKILKNNLVRRAAAKLELDYLEEHLTGANAIAFSGNIVEPAKILAKYAKEFDFFEIKGGVVENAYADSTMINELASIPNMEGLLTMLAGGMLSPLKDIAIGLNMLVEGESDFAFEAE
ncbi:MAG: 50S ribosomal protein L10 [Bacilli bacterium]